MTLYKPTLTQRVVDTTLKGITTLLCRVDGEQLKRVPTQGPLIVVTNHINFLDAPVIYPRLQPRPITGFAKIETWDSAFLGWLFDVWGIIPIRRGEADMTAIKKGLAALKDGHILAIAPEGTRSNDGLLLRGKPGIAIMALLSGAPILPLVHYGHENYRKELPRLRRSQLHAVVGCRFWLDDCGEKVTSQVRQKMTDEIMYQMAALLPPEYRGAYTDLSQASEHYLRFDPPAQSNLTPD
jgi:1-acyl-sn-glycerol-3-phosphate acyltransferase